jgi:hypothetical protein
MVGDPAGHERARDEEDDNHPGHGQPPPRQAQASRHDPPPPARLPHVDHGGGGLSPDPVQVAAGGGQADHLLVLVGRLRLRPDGRRVRHGAGGLRHRARGSP